MVYNKITMNTDSPDRIQHIADAYHQYAEVVAGVHVRQKELLDEINQVLSDQNRKKAKEDFKHILESL